MPNLKITAAYNGNTIINEVEMPSPVNVVYNNATIVSIDSESIKTLLCNGKYMATDVIIGDVASSGKTLQCSGKIMSSDVVVTAQNAMTQLATPQNVEVEVYNAGWTSVENAEEYDVYIDNSLYTNEDVYTVAGTATNAQINGASILNTMLLDHGHCIVTITADGTSYKVPVESPSVTNAQRVYTRTNDTSATLDIHTPTGAVSFEITGEQII